MYIIDGHNLIPKLPGMSLRELDDEESLVTLLQRYARGKNRRIEVFFDGAPPGMAGERSYGTIRAHYVEARLTADDAIRRYLVAQKGAARNVTVVTSDRQVQANARALHAAVLSSDDFARLLVESPPAAPKSPNPGAAQARMSDKELGGWYKLFQVDPAQAEKPIEPVRTPKPVKERKKKKRG
jgi:uncharacterized protein